MLNCGVGEQILNYEWMEVSYRKALMTAAVVGDTTKIVSVIRVGPLV